MKEKNLSWDQIGFAPNIQEQVIGGPYNHLSVLAKINS